MRKMGKMKSKGKRVLTTHNRTTSKETDPKSRDCKTRVPGTMLHKAIRHTFHFKAATRNASSDECLKSAHQSSQYIGKNTSSHITWSITERENKTWPGQGQFVTGNFNTLKELGTK